jgi:glycosyltransferase involved in cell wall biosynthesis
VSHTFVQREVEALRDRGVEIHTFAIHRSRPEDLLSDADREALRTTFTILPPGGWALLRTHVRTLVRRPFSYLRTLAFALSAPRGRRIVLSGLFHFAEAVLVSDECRRRGLRHLHAHFTSPSADVAQLAAMLGKEGARGCSWSFTAHGTDLLNDVQPRLADKVRRASLVVCVSDFGRSQLMRLVDAQHWGKLRVVRCGLGDPWLEGVTRKETHNPFCLLTVGRLEREKGHAILLEAIAELTRNGTPVRLELVGSGSQLGALRSQAARLGVADRVRFAGGVGQDTIRDRYAQADAFCLPSLSEGVPVVLMEAMATGLPVVAPQLMGIPELVEDGVSGLLVRPGRPREIARAIERLAGDAELRRRLGEEGRRKVMADFRLDESAAQLHSAFAELLEPEPAKA